MPDSARSIAELGRRIPADPASPAEARARYFNTANAFDMKLPPVPDAVFTEEPARALDPDAPTGFTACDISAELACAFPATSPLVLARYARIRAGETLTADFNATGVLAYAIRGRGSVASAGEMLNWAAGDLLLLPGGEAHPWAAEEDAVLWLVTNEPQLAFDHARAPAPGMAPTDPVHYPAAEIAEQVDLLMQTGRTEEIPGSALIFSAERQEATRNALPTLTCAMNALEPGQSQRPHRHNSVAVSLIVEGEGCYSVVDGRRKDWAPWATTITPPVSSHSHHNEGPQRAMFLIVQDGGIFYHARAMGFEFTDA